MKLFPVHINRDNYWNIKIRLVTVCWKEKKLLLLQIAEVLKAQKVAQLVDNFK